MFNTVTVDMLAEKSTRVVGTEFNAPDMHLPATNEVLDTVMAMAPFVTTPEGVSWWCSLASAIVHPALIARLTSMPVCDALASMGAAATTKRSFSCWLVLATGISEDPTATKAFFTAATMGLLVRMSTRAACPETVALWCNLIVICTPLLVDMRIAATNEVLDAGMAMAPLTTRVATTRELPPINVLPLVCAALAFVAMNVSTIESVRCWCSAVTAITGPDGWIDVCNALLHRDDGVDDASAAVIALSFHVAASHGDAHSVSLRMTLTALLLRSSPPSATTLEQLDGALLSIAGEERSTPRNMHCFKGLLLLMAYRPLDVLVWTKAVESPLWFSSDIYCQEHYGLLWEMVLPLWQHVVAAIRSNHENDFFEQFTVKHCVLVATDESSDSDNVGSCARLANLFEEPDESSLVDFAWQGCADGAQTRRAANLVGGAPTLSALTVGAVHAATTALPDANGLCAVVLYCVTVMPHGGQELANCGPDVERHANAQQRDALPVPVGCDGAKEAGRHQVLVRSPHQCVPVAVLYFCKH